MQYSAPKEDNISEDFTTDDPPSHEILEKEGGGSSGSFEDH